MLGTFQDSHIRIEIEASADDIGRSLLYPDRLRLWMWPQQLPPGLPERFQAGLRFASTLGMVTIDHQVEVADDNCLRWLLSGAIDGFHEWYWGDGWVQSRLEGVSLLPLKLGQTIALLRLQEFLGDRPSTASRN